MKYVQIIFSPTGGTEKVANTLTEKWPGVETIDLSAAGENRSKVVFQPEDVVLIAMPSFGGLAPQIALDRLSGIKGNGARCVLAAVYGNRAYEDTLVQMEDAAEKSGFRVIAAISAVAEHSIMHQSCGVHRRGRVPPRLFRCGGPAPEFAGTNMLCDIGNGTMNVMYINERRLALRPERERAAASRLQATYGDEFKTVTLYDSKLDVRDMLGERARRPRKTIDRQKREARHQELER